MIANVIHNEDCLTGLRKMPGNSIDCCVTSPPYFGLRDYGHADQIGLEETSEQYVLKMVEVFTEVKRVLKKDGTLWLNLGDSYASNAKGSGGPSEKQLSNSGSRYESRKFNHGLKEKDLMGIPWLVAFALRSSGWYLRQDIIWHKPNPMPESVTDRCTKSHEYIFLMSKSAKYYYDNEAIQTQLLDQSILRLTQNIKEQNGSNRVPGKTNGNMKAVGRPHGIVRDRLLDYDSKEKELRPNVNRGEYEFEKDLPGPDGFANKKSVWTVTTKPFSEAHFATFPEDLIVDCIKAGCPEFVCNKCGKARIKEFETEFKGDSNKRGTWNQPGRGQSGLPNDAGITKKEFLGLTDCGCNAGFSAGIVLDPFMGAATTALVAAKLNRKYVGFELNAEYIKIAEKRLNDELGMFHPNLQQ